MYVRRGARRSHRYAAILNLFRSGGSVNEVAQELGCSDDVIVMWIEKARWHRRHKQRGDGNHRWIVSRYARATEGHTDNRGSIKEENDNLASSDSAENRPVERMRPEASAARVEDSGLADWLQGLT